MRTPLLETATVTLAVTAIGLTVLYALQSHIARVLISITRILP